MDEAGGFGRLFLGVALDEWVRSALVSHLREALGSRELPGRIVPPANWHLTVRFLGQTEKLQVRRLVDMLRLRDFGPPFEVLFTELGAFPRPERARVMWLGVADTEGGRRLAELAAAAESAVRAAGFAAESRPFSTHLTLSRLQAMTDVRAVIAGVPTFGRTFPVSEIVLFRSHLGRGSARYEPLVRFALGPARADGLECGAAQSQGS